MKYPDYELLRLFLLLHRYKSTTKVAQELFMSQSSVSRGLQKLRHYFDDELFVRQPYGLEPTTKAMYLAERLPMVMESLDEVLMGVMDFNPAQLEQRLHLALNAFLVPVIGPLLVKRLTELAPNLTLFIDNWDASTVDHLLSGKVALGINYYPIESSKQIIQKKIAQDTFVMLMHNNHPLNVDVVMAEHVAQYPMAQVVINDFNETNYSNEAVLSQGLEPKVKLQSSNLMVLLESLHDSDMLMPASGGFAATVSSDYRSIPLGDYPSNPNGDIGVFQLHKYEKNPLHLWLVQEIEQIFIQLNMASPSRVNRP